MEVILSCHSDSLDDETPPTVSDLHDQLRRGMERPLIVTTNSEDLRTLLKRKIAMVADTPASESDLRTTIDKSKARKVNQTIIAPDPDLQPRAIDLRDQINSKSDDLRIRLSQSKRSDLRRRLEATKRRSETALHADNSIDDPLAQLESMRATRALHLNVIMGSSPSCGDSVRAVKDYRRQATTRRNGLHK